MRLGRYFDFSATVRKVVVVAIEMGPLYNVPLVSLGSLASVV